MMISKGNNNYVNDRIGWVGKGSLMFLVMDGVGI